MKNKYILLNILIIVSILFCMNLNVYGAGASYDLPIEYEDYSYSSEYEKYIGLYYTVAWQGEGPSANGFSESNSSLYNGIFTLNPTIKKSELEKWYSTTIPGKGCIVYYSKYNKDDLEKVFTNSSTYKMEDSQEIYLKSGSMLFLEKGTLTITDDSGNVLAKLPHYVICSREDIKAGNETLKRFTVVRYHNSSDIYADLQTIMTTYNNFKTDTNVRNEAGTDNGANQNNEASDFWGDASSWFGNLKGSYETPSEVNDIIEIFSDMINVVGTTLIVVATIVLGIKYIIGTVESQTSAKEGLINLFIACVFFFGWTSIKNLLFPGNNFIFTSDTDTTYTNIVGRLFSTFTYIAQFIVVASIIYVGIKYIFAGADGRAELKGKSVYFIIGIILVFATTNVLSFISELIDQTL